MTKSKSQVLKENSFDEPFFNEPLIRLSVAEKILESSLTQQKSEIIKEIEGMKGHYNCYECNLGDEALDDVIEQLKK